MIKLQFTESEVESIKLIALQRFNTNIISKDNQSNFLTRCYIEAIEIVLSQRNKEIK